ncbi:hypothetical protein CASFOL_010993 [Castilleja foliolosa]|uniref:Pectinesterase inhibitor domain-containing protein n=1 Tax=Castilleja foliolosa TaxID=1961234 RepID=A0ABD3DUM8_9LAMI
MAIFAANVTLFILCCFISLASAARHNRPLKCAETQQTSTSATHTSIYSDPWAATADRIVLAYIAFGNAYLNSSNTQAQIRIKITDNKGGKSNVLDWLKSCTGHYSNAIGALSQALGNLDSDSYYGFDKLSIEAQGHVRNCEESFNGTTTSPMTKENGDLIKLTGICYAVAQLFPYTD